MFEAIQSNNSNNHIVNSTITRVDITRTANSSDGTYVNSTLLSNPERSKLLVETIIHHRLLSIQHLTLPTTFSNTIKQYHGKIFRRFQFRVFLEP
jgi:hypothetical protein